MLLEPRCTRSITNSPHRLLLAISTGFAFWWFLTKNKLEQLLLGHVRAEFWPYNTQFLLEYLAPAAIFYFYLLFWDTRYNCIDKLFNQR